MAKRFLWTIGMVAFLGALSQGCGRAEDVDVLVALVPRPEGTPVRSLLDQLATLEWVFDAPGGFAGLTGERFGKFQVEDVDRDLQPELLFAMTVAGREDLPVLGLDLGHEGSNPIAIRVRGVDPAGGIAAFGGLPAQVLFAGSKRNLIEVPLALARDHLAPRVVALTPQRLPLNGELQAVAFLTSGPLDPATLAGHVSVLLIPVGAGAEIPVDGALTGPTGCPFGTEMWVFEPAACHQEAFFSAVKVVLDPQVLDRQGRPLQDAAGQAGFVGTVSLGVSAAFGPCAPATSCEQIGMAAPDNTSLRCDLVTGRFVPAICSVNPDGCRDPADAFAWVQAVNDAACQAFRPDSREVQGGCVVSDPWPCSGPAACVGISTKCQMGQRQCTPDSCTDSCTNPALQCLPAEGCLPRLGGCAQPCEVSGGCAEFAEGCGMGEDDRQVCRPLP